MTVQSFILALSLGAMVSIYFPMVAQSARILGSGPLANVPFFAMALVTSIGIAIATGSRAEGFVRTTQLPAWLFAAGIMSAGLIIGSSYLIPRIGLGAFFVLMVSGQILASMAFGLFGLFGVPETPLTLSKVAGAAMVIGGVYLTSFK